MDMWTRRPIGKSKVQGEIRRFLYSTVSTRISRRQLFRRVLALGTVFGAFSLSGCRFDSGSDGELGGVLNFIGYDGEEGRNVARPFLEANGIKMQATFMGSADEALTKFMTGGRGLMDIVASNKDFIRALLASEIEFFQPLDMDRIPNAGGLFPAFKEAPWLIRDGQIFAVPLIWGDEPCVYNPQKWDGVPPKYTDFADPRCTGELVFLNDPFGNIWLFAKSLGMPQPNRLTQEELDEVLRAMLTVKPNIVAFGASLGDMVDIMIRGDASMGIGGWAFQTIIAAEKGVELRVATPAIDGTFFWCDAYSLAVDAPNRENAYAFINFMISPEANAAIATELGSGATVEKAFELMDEKTRGLFPYDTVKRPDGGILNTQIVIPPQEDEGEIVGASKWAKAWEIFRLS